CGWEFGSQKAALDRGAELFGRFPMLFALKIKTLLTAVVVAGPVAVSAVTLGGRTHSPAAGVTVPETVEVAPGAFRHRAAGDYTRDGAPAAAPVTEVRFVHPLRIMRDQVSAGDYQRCVAAGGGAPAAGDRGDLPAGQGGRRGRRRPRA